MNMENLNENIIPDGTPEIADFEQRNARVRRTVKWSLTYNDQEIEGIMKEDYDDLWSNWDREVEIEDYESLTQEDIDYITDYVLENIK
jgi:hypothetical protein